MGIKPLTLHPLVMYFLTFAVATACIARSLHKLFVYAAAVTFRGPIWTIVIFVELIVSANCKLKNISHMNVLTDTDRA